ncbi:hypothetical protein EXU32_15155 [Janibacter limosus]|jgi:non-ribosomal peptide synthetase component F|uniref:AMP-dependent synthetase/ligase domain-containing protein n=2 Tax=Janibacter limosus TaxID=53458 RepID=A0A4P6MZM0_9MICO|nr:hypothetical protein EXU32_15155 [Janibacter limosus]
MRQPIPSESIPGRIHAWVAMTPDAVAVQESTRTLAYAQLWDHAGRVAENLLTHHDVHPGETICVALEPSIDAITVMLGVLRAGAVIAAVDPRWPQPRRDLIRVELGVTVSVGTGGGDIRPQDLLSPPPRPHEQALPVVDAGSIATIFFTSGTSAAPKMVASPHQALTRLIGPGRTLLTEPGHVMLHASRPGWDVHSLETWGTLSGGGTVHVLAGGVFPDSVISAVDAGVDHAWITSSLLNLLIDEDIDCLAGLRTIFTGGEKLSAPHVAKFLERHPHTTLINGYGPVESCVFATTHTVTSADLDDIPIGRPVSGTTIALVTQGDVPADLLGGQPGDTGEIWLGGTGLATGYVNAPDSDDRFVTAGPEGQRWYRTGDQAWLAPDGSYRFRGRLDRQVKIRGARVQPEELEAQATSILGVSCRAEPVPGRWSGYDRLALFIGPGITTSPTEVRQALASALPKHLVPDVVVCVPTLPVTANGKVDSHTLLEALASSGEAQPCRS